MILSLGSARWGGASSSRCSAALQCGRSARRSRRCQCLALLMARVGPRIYFSGSSVFLMRQVDRDVLPLRVALEHAFEGELTADAAFFVTAVGMTWALTEALVHLNPASLDCVCRAQSPADVMRPDVGGEPVMAVIRHANRVRFVGPRNGNKHGAKDLLARQAPVVGNVREDGGDCVIAFAQGPFLGRETADHEARFASLKSFLDIATHFPELLLIDDGTYVTCLIKRIAELERFDFLPERIEKIVEDVAV